MPLLLTPLDSVIMVCTYSILDLLKFKTVGFIVSVHNYLHIRKLLNFCAWQTFQNFYENHISHSI